MFVRLEVQACMSVARFLVKSHGCATIVMGCMMFHHSRTQQPTKAQNFPQQEVDWFS
jgi:hypothetical protein